MRYLPHTDATRAEMLKSIGVKHIDELFTDVPNKFLLKKPLDLPAHKSEMEVENILTKLANKNKVGLPNIGAFLGAGCYHHHIPATVDYIIQRSEFLTSYTPYQPEVSQGTLTTIFEFQSYICALTGMDVSNASMYDGATACAEAALMAKRVTKRKNVIVASGLNPMYYDTLDTYLNHSNGEIISGDTLDETTACVIVQSPNFYGEIIDIAPYKQKCEKSGALLIVIITEILSLGLINPPKDADIVCGEASSIGNSMNFGGPNLGFFACKQKYLRQMPGRICGETVDNQNRRSYVLTLSTREQHIRREKATSNICTNEGLCALAFTVHTSLLGEEGFKKLALINHQQACKLADTLSKIEGIHIKNKTFFNEFVVILPQKAQKIADILTTFNIIPGLVISEHEMLLASTELTTNAEIYNTCNTIASILEENKCT